ncbi:MAG: Rdx family protein [Deferribacterales bacterium]
MELIRGSGGVFEISVNGELIYSKKQTGVFPDEDDLLAKIQGMAL